MSTSTNGAPEAAPEASLYMQLTPARSPPPSARTRRPVDLNSDVTSAGEPKMAVQGLAAVAWVGNVVGAEDEGEALIDVAAPPADDPWL